MCTPSRSELLRARNRLEALKDILAYNDSYASTLRAHFLSECRCKRARCTWRWNEPPAFLRPAVADEPRPSLANLPNELVEMVVRSSAAMDVMDLPRLRRTCRALSQMVQTLMPHILIDCGLLDRRGKCWSMSAPAREWKHDSPPFPNSFVATRAYGACIEPELMPYLRRGGSASLAADWQMPRLAGMQWGDARPLTLAHATVSQPTAAYRAYIAAIDERLRLMRGMRSLPDLHRLDGLALGRLVGRLEGFVRVSMCRIAGAYTAAAKLHPTVFTRRRLEHLYEAAHMDLAHHASTNDYLAAQAQFICDSIAVLSGRLCELAATGMATADLPPVDAAQVFIFNTRDLELVRRRADGIYRAMVEQYHGRHPLAASALAEIADALCVAGRPDLGAAVGPATQTHVGRMLLGEMHRCLQNGKLAPADRTALLLQYGPPLAHAGAQPTD